VKVLSTQPCACVGSMLFILFKLLLTVANPATPPADVPKLVSVSPGVEATNVCIDTLLRLVFDRPPTLSKSGTVQILDGCNMDDGFAFSFSRTQEEWEEEIRRMEEIGQSIRRECVDDGGLDIVH
jgi:hypothetical protein